MTFLSLIMFRCWFLSLIALCVCSLSPNNLDNPPPLPVTVPPLKERHFGVHQSPRGPPPPQPGAGGHGNANFHHAMLSPPVAGQSTFHPVPQQPQPMHRMQQQTPGENYYNVPVHQHTHGGIIGNEMPPPGGVAMIPHAHFRHPADLSYSSAEMRQS